MYAVCGKQAPPPYSVLEHDAVAACGRLPLVLNIAGGLLRQAGGVITKEFVQMISEDHYEVSPGRPPPILGASFLLF